MELQFVLIAHVVGICFGLKDVRIQIPTTVKKGDSAIFHCWYNTEGDSLYAVKWYKGRHEFYRYTPKERPAIKTFSIGTLSVNKDESNATQVAVTGLELDAAGRYSCEVSEDAPSFHTSIKSANMNVVELPMRLPTIHGMQRKYRVGDTLRANCTSDGSKPPANLTWFVNDRQALQAHIRNYNPLESNSAEQQSSFVGLQFLITAKHFASGKLKARCSASIFDVYWQSTEVSAEEDRPKGSTFEPAATIVGINYLQPPPNFQTGQRKPDGQVDVKDIGSSAGRRRFVSLIFKLLLILQVVIR